MSFQFQAAHTTKHPGDTVLCSIIFKEINLTIKLESADWIHVNLIIASNVAQQPHDTT